MQQPRHHLPLFLLVLLLLLQSSVIASPRITTNRADPDMSGSRLDAGSRNTLHTSPATTNRGLLSLAATRDTTETRVPFAASRVGPRAFLPLIAHDEPPIAINVTPEHGGVLRVARDGVQLTIPPGAVTTPTTIGYERTPTSRVAGKLLPLSFILTAQDVNGHDIHTFHVPLHLEIDYPAAPFVREEALRLHFSADGRTWTAMPTQVSIADNRLSVDLAHFTHFAAIGPETPIGSITTLCAGTEIRQGPGLAVHTIVPVDDWEVLITERRDIAGEIWWNIDRKALDQLPTSGTGWVSQTQADQACLVTNDEGDPTQIGLLPLSAELRALLRTLGYPREWMIQFMQGDPVYPPTGNFMLRQTDLNIHGVAGMDFAFERVYNSRDERVGAFGRGMSSLLDMNARIAIDGSVDVRYPDGHGAVFQAQGGRYAPADRGIFDTLSSAGNMLQLTTPDQLVYALTVITPTQALLTDIRDRNGNHITLERNTAGRVTRIFDSADRLYELAYSGDFVASIRDISNRSIQYSYTSDMLERVIDGNGNAHRFVFRNGRMEDLIDPLGQRYLSNRYDQQSRVTEQFDSADRRATFVYNDRETIFTDYLTNPTTLRYDERDRVTEMVDALQQIQRFAYDTDDNLTSFTNERGHTWLSTFDERGNLLTSTDPLSATVRYRYNGTNDLVEMTDQGGPSTTARTTTFAYEGRGNLIHIGRPDGTAIDATYDSRGQMRTHTNPRRFTTTFAYNPQGDLITSSDPLSHITSFTHDTVGRVRTRTDAQQRLTRFRYDGNDNLVEIIDPKGQRTTLNYDGNNSLIVVADRRSGLTRFTYDANLKLTSVSDPLKHTTTFKNDAVGNRVMMTDPRGNPTHYRYDPIYRLSEIEDAFKQITRLHYDPADNLEQIIDPLAQTTRFVYDPLNRPTDQLDPLQGTTSLRYDAVDRVISQSNPRGALTRFNYDLLDRLTLLEDPLQGQWHVAYDANGNPTGWTDANSHTTQATYDDADRRIAVIEPGGYTTRYAYDAVGNTLVISDAQSYATHFGYDPNDNRETITDALGGVTTIGYDPEDALVALTDANGNTTRLERDLDGLVITLLEAGGQISRFSYDAAHNLEAFTNAKGKIWHFGYDALNRRITQRDPLDNLTRFGYDPVSRLTQITNARGIATHYDYDALNRLVAVIEHARADQPADHDTNVTTRYGYDPAGNLLDMLDANGNLSHFEYDLLNRVVTEINPLAQIWRYRYDPVGNLIERRDATGAITGYSYDVNDQLRTISYPGSTTVSFAYDAVHNQTEMRDTLGTLRNAYDPLHRLTAQTNHLGQHVGYTYDAVGNRTRLIYPDGRAMTYRYDVTNVVDRVTDPDGQIFAVTRDLTHNIMTVANPNGTRAEQRYDDADRLTTVRNLTADGTVISSFAYTLDAVGSRTRTVAQYSWRKPQALVTSYTYDPLDRLVRSSDGDGHFNEYDYDGMGNRLRHVTNDEPTLTRAIDTTTTTASFNAANQLIDTLRETAPRGNPNRSDQIGLALRAFVHELDAQAGKHIDATTAASLRAAALGLIGDLDAGSPPSADATATRIAELRAAVATARDGGRIDNAGVANSLLLKLSHADDANARRGGELAVALYEYDANGNRVRRTTTDDGTANERDWLRTDYTYNSEGRLLSTRDFRDPGSDAWQPGDLTKLTYDGYGRLFQRLHDQRAGGGGQKWTEYVYDGLDPIVEYQEPSPQYINYYRGLDRILSMRPFRSQQSPNGTIDYFHYDGLGSVSALTKHTGQRSHTYRYANYGTILDVNGKAADASNFTDPHNHYAYTGQEWDEQTGVLHFYAREYEPATGIWLQPDPYRGRIAEPETLHRYGYVGQNPVTHVDLWGFDRLNIPLGSLLSYNYHIGYIDQCGNFVSGNKPNGLYIDSCGNIARQGVGPKLPALPKLPGPQWAEVFAFIRLISPDFVPGPPGSSPASDAIDGLEKAAEGFPPPGPGAVKTVTTITKVVGTIYNTIYDTSTNNNESVLNLRPALSKLDIWEFLTNPMPVAPRTGDPYPDPVPTPKPPR